MGKEKGYNSRFTSNTETVSRVACYLYIKATRKLAAALAYGIHRSIYRLFLSFPLHSTLDEFLIFPPPLPSHPHSLLSASFILDTPSTLGRFRRTGRQASPHSRSFRQYFRPSLASRSWPSLPPPIPRSRTPRQRIIYWASFFTGNLCWPQSCHARENGGNINSRRGEAAEGAAFEHECLQNVSKRS